ncbi:uncharacterized protein LOC143149233 isoform X2 [Ptiloglossa arizonensis]|uniref:uncharacterized protein LOC143149233 isoform X2 n=1 Tax=Ptiloglossa arizonensis TaxID=3350558 RepID=UPI003FA07DE0
MEQVFATADKLSEVIWNIQKCLQCTICLNIISEPMKTRCGHHFCRECIQKVLQSKNAFCPMCNTSLPRRGLSKDEHMELYIDNLQKLTEAVKKDSGIDISFCTTRTRTTRESCLSDATEHHKFENEESGPSCSKVKPSALKRLSGPRAKDSAKKRKKISRSVKSKKNNDNDNDIKRYLNKYALSGIEPLAPEESVSCYDDDSMDTKVKSWLETLPKNDALDNPEKIGTTQQPIECDLDDTITTSISRVGENVKCDASERNEAKSRFVQPGNDDGKNRERRATEKRFSKDSSREMRGNATTTADDTWRSPETDEFGARKTRGKARQTLANAENQRPSTSGTTRTNEESKEQERKSTDVHRTSPCNMLPVMKQNWSCIAKFGKELRPRKKKLRSLDVNIESKNNRRSSLNETETEGIVKYGAIKNTRDKGTKTGANSYERISNTTEDSSEKNTLPNNRAARKKERNLSRSWTRAEETPIGNKGDGSTYAEVPTAEEESSFIADEKGEQLYIETLNSSQIKNIIGVERSEQDRRSEIGNVQIDPERDVLPLKKRTLLSRTPARDRFEDSLQVTPTKAAVEVSPGKSNATSGLANCSPDLVNLNCLFQDEETSVAPSPTSSRNRLSLMRSSAEVKSNESAKTNDVSRLLAVKRDLNRIMDRDTDDSLDEGSRSRLTDETKGKRDGNNEQKSNKRAAERIVGHRDSISSNENTGKQQDDKGTCKSFVTFKKLGKVRKYRKKLVSFLYLGPTRPKTLQSQNYPRLRLQERSDPTEDGQSSTQKCGNYFDNDTQIMSDRTQRVEDEDSLPIRSTYVVTKEMDGYEAGFGSIQPGASMDKASATKRVDAHPSTQNFASENRFSNDARITVNDTSLDEVGSSLPIEPTYVPKKTTQTLKAGTGHSRSVQPGPSMDKLRTTKRIDIYKDKLPITPATSSLENESRESNDVLFVSIFDNEEKDPACSRSSIPERTVVKSGIKPLSPKKDSHLKFPDLDSPRQADALEDPNVKKSNFSEIKGANSRALIRKSQQAHETSKLDSSSDRKRKRSTNGDKYDHEAKRTSMNDEEDRAKDSDFDSDRCSKSTYVTNKHRMKTVTTDGKARSCIFSSNSIKDATTVLLSSDTDSDNKESRNAAMEERRSFKRVLPLASSDTDSNEASCLNSRGNGANDQASTASKRKRAPSPDSDCNAELNVIVSNWYRDLNPSESRTKKGKLEQTRVPSAFMSLSKENRPNDSLKSSNSFTFDLCKMADGNASKYRSVIDISSSSGRSESLGVKKIGKTLGSKETFNSNDSPDFGSIVDKMRDIQRSGVVIDVENNEQRDANLMQDNFDEIMANVDTEALINEYSTNKGSRRNDRVEITEQERSMFRSSKDDAIPPKSNVSDKENKYKDLDVLYESFNADDKTLMSEYTKLVDKCSKRRFAGNDESRTRIKPTESTSKEPSRSNNPRERTSARNPMFPDNDKVDEDTDNDATLKETCYEQDSLMDITQHYLQIKQFEEDLFGKTANTNAQPDKREEMNEPQTPQKTKNGNAGCSNSKETDAEHSGEEDDIVENTPDVKTKNAQPIDSTTKESSNASPVSRMGRFDRTPSSIAGRSSSSASPLCKRIPLCQSTPKVQVTAKNGSRPAELHPTNKEFKHSASTNDKRPKNVVSVTGGASFGRQKLCFVCSGLVQAQIEHVKRLASMVNARYVTQFDPEVTHVIVKTDDGNNGASKTLKYLQGIAHRKWILGAQWVIDSLKAKKLINEERYEVVDCRTLEAGPRNSRLRERDLFAGFVFLCIGPYVDVSIEQYQELLRATGATVVGSLQALATEKGRLKIIMIQADIHDYGVIEWYKQSHAVSVVHDWVVECISQYKLISFYPYLQELSRQDVLALGYPEFLVEEDLDADSDVEEDPDADSIRDVLT